MSFSLYCLKHMILYKSVPQAFVLNLKHSVLYVVIKSYL